MVPPDAGDTIVGLSSPPGGAPRGIVRLSGRAALDLVGAAFEPWPPAGDDAHAPRGSWRILAGSVAGPEGSRAPARCLAMRAPRSYTREDVVEIHTLGSPPLLQSIVERLAAAGARPADPGEFTLRAFLNGRIDLAQAEAVSEVIAAQDRAAYRRAQRVLAGVTGATLRSVRDAVLVLRAELEAELDFPEEDGIAARARAAREGDILRLRDALVAAAGSASRGTTFGRVRIVFAGRANAGKSTLLNALVGNDRALVHEAPGTTTDAVTADIELGGVDCTLVDTAGTGAPAARLAAAAAAVRREELSAADLVVGVVDLSLPGASEAAAELEAEAACALVVGTKLDVAGGLGFGAFASGRPVVSAATGEGIGALRERLGGAAAARAAAGGGELVTTRQREAVDRARAALDGAATELARAELCALELGAAEEALGEVLGEGAPSDLLGAIFGRFCIGK